MLPIILIIIGQLVIIALLLFQNKSQKPKQVYQETSSFSPEKIKAFYNSTTDKFLEVYGEVIQAYRTNNTDDLLNYIALSAGFKENIKVLDAGCGVCGPAVFFASKFKEISIEACTISNVQHEKALSTIETKNLSEKVNVVELDYHLLESKYQKNSFDLAYFLESFGHSNNQDKVIDSVWEVLKPGGSLYIKDLFKRISLDPWEQEYIDKISNDINNAYKYNISNLSKTLDKIRSKGFILKFVKTPEIDLDKFENLSISNDFQNLFNIGKIESWDQYVFPIDFYEIKAQKPIFDINKNKHLYHDNQVKK